MNTKDLHPGLGERLAAIPGDVDTLISRMIYGETVEDVRRKVAGYLERALSLSSPIEPPPDRDLLRAEIARKWAKSAVEGLVRRNIIGRYLADEADARDGIADSIKGAIHEALSVGGAQASSEIREALRDAEYVLANAAVVVRGWAKESREGGWSTHQVKPNQDLADALSKAASRLTGALAPSRQGAAKRVEG